MLPIRDQDQPQRELFQIELEQLIDRRHPLVHLEMRINWASFEEVLGMTYHPTHGASHPCPAKARQEQGYSVHEQEVECIAKGKAGKQYEFGNKVSLAVTSRGGWMGARKVSRAIPMMATRWPHG